MKRLVKLFSLILAVGILSVSLTGCGKKERVLYSTADLSKFVTLGEYTDIPVEMESDTLKEYISEMAVYDAEQNELYNELKEGKVADGDIANIDYEGKKDGVAFEGGTAEGSDLEIGSGSFIEGFESGLIGVAIGDTVDLNLTFPEDYGNEELNGQDVVFTVKVNYVKRLKEADESYSDLGFKTYAAYEKDLEERAAKQYLLDTVCANSKIKDYPSEDMNYLYEQQKTMLESNVTSQYGIDFATYLQYIGMTEDTFKTDFVTQQIKPMMDTQMVIYAIIDEEKLEVDTADIEKEAEEYVKSLGSEDVTVEDVKEYYGEYYFEEVAATEKVMDYLYENAKIQ